MENYRKFAIEVTGKAGKLLCHNVLSEERDPIDLNSDLTWVLDPLDGTVPYVRGFSDAFAVSIGLVRNKTPIMGVIFAPAMAGGRISFSGQSGLTQRNT